MLHSSICRCVLAHLEMEDSFGESTREGPRTARSD